MSDTTNTTENMEQVTEQEKEMQEAQASGVVNFDDKKKDKEEDGSLNYTHTFKKPREIEGKKYTKLTFYFDNLTGEDIEAVEQELADQNKYALSPEISSAFQCILAAKAARVASDEIRRLPVGDYMKIKNKARDFFNCCGLLKIKEPAKFIRKQIYKMSRASHTPVPFWLQMPIRRLFAWIETINEVEKEEAEEQKQNSNNA